MRIILHELSLMQVPMLIDWLKRYPRESCDYNVCNLLTWGKVYHNQFCEYKGRLVIYNPMHSFILFPVGEWMPAFELAQLMRDFEEVSAKASLIQIPAEYIEAHPEINDYFDLKRDETWSDYIYSVEKMVNLPGKKLAKKKNLINQFKRGYPEYKVRPLSESRRQVILQFTNKWKRERQIEDLYLNTEYAAIQNTLEMWDHLPVDGIVICLHNRIVAYSIFSAQTADMATVHFEKFDPEKKGSAQVINWETARYLQPEYRWINREQDIGIEGLRQAKRSYMPDRMSQFISGSLKAQSNVMAADF